MRPGQQVRRTERAAPLPPDARRQAIVEATVPLLIEHGRALTTRQIAHAAGIAEGTIFRVFESKEELVDAALAEAFEPGPLLKELEGINREQPLRDRLVDLVTVLQQRFLEIFGLMRAVGLVAPPARLDADEAESWRVRAREVMVDLVGEDANRLRVPVEQLIHVLRLLTFSGSHHELADGHLLTPAQIVDVVLVGVLRCRDEE